MNEIFVPQLLGEYYKKNQTGILVLQNNSIIKTVHFNRGNIVFATSNLVNERLGERLVEWGVLEQNALDQASEWMKACQLKLGQVLVEMNFVQEESLKGLVTRQVAEIVFSTFQWQSLSAEFEEVILPDYEFKISMSTAQILLEGMRNVSEINFLKKMIGDVGSSLECSDDPRLLYQIFALQPQEAFIISSLEQTPYSTQELVEMSVVPELVILRTICALLQAGVLTITNSESELLIPDPILTNLTATRSIDSSILFDTRSVMQFCNEVESKISAINAGVSHYELLGVKHHSSEDELKAAYSKLARHFHPDRQAQLNDYNINLNQELSIIFNKLAESINALVKPKSQLIDEKNVSGLFKRPASSLPQTNSTRASQPGRAGAKMGQREMMQYCYEVENKLAAIKGGATYYQILELERDVSPKAIEAAYLRLSEKFSTQRQLEFAAFGIDLTAQLKQISYALFQALEMIRNPAQKQIYDQKLSQQLRRNTGPLQSAQMPVSTKPPSTPLPSSPFNRAAGSPPSHPPAPEPSPMPNAAHKSSPPSQPLAPPPGGSLPPAPPAKINITSPKDKTTVAEDFYFKATRLYDAQLFEQACIEVKKAIELIKDNARYWILMAHISSQMPGALKQTEDAYYEAMRFSPKDANFPAELGLIYQKHGLQKKAIEMFQRALEISPDHAAAKMALGSAPKLAPKPEQKSAPTDKIPTGALNQFLSRFGLSKDSDK